MITKKRFFTRKKLYVKEDASLNKAPAYLETSSRNSRTFTISIIVVLFVVIVLIGLYFLGTTQKRNNQTITQNTFSLPVRVTVPASPSVIPSKTASPAASVTPTPTTHTLSRKDISLTILNGSGIPGSAKTIADHMQELGYDIQTVGNAESFSYTDITLKIKKTKEDYLALLQKDIKDVNSTASISAQTTDTISTDAVIIVGK